MIIFEIKCHQYLKAGEKKENYSNIKIFRMKILNGICDIASKFKKSPAHSENGK